MGAGEIEKDGVGGWWGGNARAKRCEEKAQGAWFLKPPRGRGVLLSGRSRIQMHPSGTPGLPFTSIAISPSVCDMDTVTAPPSSHNTENPLRISVGALIPEECDSVHVKSSRWQCLQSFQKVW